jgi:hypothetical protein
MQQTLLQILKYANHDVLGDVSYTLKVGRILHLTLDMNIIYLPLLKIRHTMPPLFLKGYS